MPSFIRLVDGQTEAFVAQNSYRSTYATKLQPKSMQGHDNLNTTATAIAIASSRYPLSRLLYHLSDRHNGIR